MSLYRQFEFASQADLDKFVIILSLFYLNLFHLQNKLIEQHNIDAVEMDGFDEVDVTIMCVKLQYILLIQHTRNAEEYLKMAEVYLKQDNPDTMQAGEKVLVLNLLFKI